MNFRGLPSIKFSFIGNGKTFSFAETPYLVACRLFWHLKFIPAMNAPSLSVTAFLYLKTRTLGQPTLGEPTLGEPFFQRHSIK